LSSLWPHSLTQTVLSSAQRDRSVGLEQWRVPWRRYGTWRRHGLIDQRLGMMIKCIPARRNAPLSEKRAQVPRAPAYHNRRGLHSSMEKDLRDMFSSFLYLQSPFRLKVTLMWRCLRIFTSSDEGCISLCGWRFKRPIVRDKANATQKFGMSLPVRFFNVRDRREGLER
jgi:hypothetical protein